MLQNENGALFPLALAARLRDEFYFVDRDSDGAERLFFDNSGGALRLRRAVEAKCALEAYPDCPDRPHERALYLREIVEHGTREILSTVFGASEGALITELTASQAMFHMVGMILEHVPGGNVVVSSLEHPSAFDAVCYHAKRYGNGGMLMNAVIALFATLFFLISDFIKPETRGITIPDGMLPLALINACLFAAGFYFAFLAFKVGPYGLTRLVASFSLLFTIFYGILFLHEEIEIYIKITGA